MEENKDKSIDNDGNVSAENDNVFSKMDKMYDMLVEMRNKDKSRNVSVVQSPQVTLNRFLAGATKEYGWSGRQRTFAAVKNFTRITPVIMAVITLVITVLSSIGWKEYVPTTHIETVYAALLIWLVTVKVGRAGNVIDEKSLQKLSVYNFFDDHNLVRTSDVKFRYSLIYTFMMILSFMNVCLNAVFSAVKDYEIFATISILETIMFLLTVVSYIVLRLFYSKYDYIYLTGYSVSADKKVTIVGDLTLNSYFTLQEYTMIYPERNYPPVKRG